MDITAILTQDLGPTVEATITADGVDIGLVTLAWAGGVCIAQGDNWASREVAMWVAGRPNAQRARWAIEAAVNEVAPVLEVAA